MHRLPTTAVVGMLALTGGCSLFESNSNSNSIAVQSRVKLPSKTVQKLALGNLFESHSMVQNPPAISSKSTGLIKSIDAIKQIKQVPQGRPDPFFPVFTVPPEIVAKPQIAVPSLPPEPIPQELPPSLLPLAKVPSLDLAKGVAVQGVIETSLGLHAIIQLPNEATSRYVSVGQLLADGQILVKKININSDCDPSVTLEQEGIEVVKAVGEEPAGLSDKKQPTAAIPASPLVASEQSEEVKLQPPIKPHGAVVKSGSYPKMYSSLSRRSSLLAAKKSLPAINPMDVAQTSSASVDLPSPSPNLPEPPEKLLARREESTLLDISLPKIQPSSSARQYGLQLGDRSLNSLASSKSFSATELNSQAARYKELISKLRRFSSPSDTLPPVETNTTQARYKELISRLDKPSKLSNNSPATKLNTQAARYKELISKLRK